MVHHDGIGISSNPDHFTRDIRNSAHNPGYPKPESNSRDYRQIGDNRSVDKTADPHGTEIQPCTEYDNQHLHTHDAGKVKAIPKGIIFFQLFPVKPSQLETGQHKQKPSGYLVPAPHMPSGRQPYRQNTSQQTPAKNQPLILQINHRQDLAHQYIDHFQHKKHRYKPCRKIVKELVPVKKWRQEHSF